MMMLKNCYHHYHNVKKEKPLLMPNQTKKVPFLDFPLFFFLSVGIYKPTCFMIFFQFYLKLTVKMLENYNIFFCFFINRVKERLYGSISIV